METNNDKKYKIDSIWDSIVYIKKLIKQLFKFYNLILWKSYFKKKLPKNLYWLFNIFKILSLFIIKII